MKLKYISTSTRPQCSTAYSHRLWKCRNDRVKQNEYIFLFGHKVDNMQNIFHMSANIYGSNVREPTPILHTIEQMQRRTISGCSRLCIMSVWMAVYLNFMLNLRAMLFVRFNDGLSWSIAKSPIFMQHHWFLSVVRLFVCSFVQKSKETSTNERNELLHCCDPLPPPSKCGIHCGHLVNITIGTCN